MKVLGIILVFISTALMVYFGVYNNNTAVTFSGILLIIACGIFSKPYWFQRKLGNKD